MSDHERAADAERRHRLAQKSGLRRGRPDLAPRARGVAETGPVERNHPMGLGERVHKAAHAEVFGADAVSVQQHEGRARALLEEVQPHPVDGHKLPPCGVTRFAPPGQEVVGDRRHARTEGERTPQRVSTTTIAPRELEGGPAAWRVRRGEGGES